MAGIDLAIAGMIYAVSATMGEGTQALFGKLSDSGWRKTLILCGMALTTAAAWFAFTTNHWLLFFIFLTVCIGSGAFHPAAVGLISQLTAKKKSFYITHFAAFGSLGLATSQIVYAYIYGVLNGNTLIIMIPTLAVIFLCMRKGLLESANTPKLEKVEPPKFSLLLKFFKNRDLRHLYITQVCNQTIAWGVIFLLPDVLKSRGYSDWMVYGGAHLIYIMGGVLLLIPSGLLADKFSSRSVIVGATITASFLYYSFLWFPGLSDASTLLLLFAMGGTISVVNPVSVAFGNKLAPQHPGMVSAFLMGCVWCVSEFFGPGGGGLLTKLFTEDAPARALMIVGLMFSMALWSGLKLPMEVAEQTPTSVES